MVKWMKSTHFMRYASVLLVGETASVQPDIAAAISGDR